MMKRFFAYIFLIAVLLTACTPQKVRSAEPGATPSGEEGETLIIFTRSGGLQGKTETWTIYPDGRVFSSSGKDWTVAASQVETLLATMDEAGFYTKIGDYAMLSQCRDCYQYTVKVEKGGLAYILTTEDADQDTPPEIWNIIKQLNEIVSSG